VPTVGDTFGNPSYSAVVHTTYVISPTLLNEAAFNYNGNRISIIPTGVYKAPSDYVFNRLFTGPNIDSRIPSVYLNGSTQTQYTSNWTPWTNAANDWAMPHSTKKMLFSPPVTGITFRGLSMLRTTGA
jgi:hypothetical protein